MEGESYGDAWERWNRDEVTQRSEADELRFKRRAVPGHASAQNFKRQKERAADGGS